jgi:hypothetical protein
MRELRPGTEAEMVALFLRTELPSDRWGNEIQALLECAGLRQPDCSCDGSRRGYYGDTLGLGGHAEPDGNERVDCRSARRAATVDFAFQGRIWEWRGPAPYHFVSIPAEHAEVVNELAPGITYGWGMVPVEACLGRTSWRTSLFPKDGGYVLPLRESVRGREDVELGDLVSIQLTIRQP